MASRFSYFKDRPDRGLKRIAECFRNIRGNNTKKKVKRLRGFSQLSERLEVEAADMANPFEVGMDAEDFLHQNLLGNDAFSDESSSDDSSSDDDKVTVGGNDSTGEAVDIERDESETVAGSVVVSPIQKTPASKSSGSRRRSGRKLASE